MALPLPHSGRSSPASKNAIDEIPFKGSEVYLQIFDNDMYNEVLAFTDDEEDTDKDELAERLEPDDEEMIEEHIPPTEQRIWSKLTGSDGSVTREERAWAENEMAEFIAKPEIETENVLKNSSSGPSAFNSKSIAEGYPSLSEAQEPQNAKGGLGSKTGHELQEAAGEAAPVRRRGTQRGQAPNHHVRSRSMIAKERNKNWGFLPPSGTQPKVVSRQCSVCGQRIIDDKEPVYTADGLYVAMKSAMLLEPSGEEKVCRCRYLGSQVARPCDTSLTWARRYLLVARTRSRREDPAVGKRGRVSKTYITSEGESRQTNSIMLKRGSASRG